MVATEMAAGWNDLVNGLACYDVRYLMGGSGSSARDVKPPVATLALELAGSRHARLRDALIALLLRHSELTPAIEKTARGCNDEPVRRLLHLSLVVAAALQQEWGFTLALYLPEQTAIEADQLCEEFGIPKPAEDFGRPCLRAVARLLRNDAPFPFNYEAGWEDTVRRLLVQLVREARINGA